MARGAFCSLPGKLVVFGDWAQAVAGALDAADVAYRDNFDSIDEKMEEGKETRDGEAYDEGFYRLTVSGKKNVQGAIQALVGENGEYGALVLQDGALVLQDEGGSLRILLNPKTVDMESVPTLEKAKAQNERLKQEIEARNQQKIAAWEARTGLAYDPDWRAKQQAEAQVQAVVQEQEQEAMPEAQAQEEELASSVMDAQDALAQAGCRRLARRARATSQVWRATRP